VLAQPTTLEVIYFCQSSSCYGTPTINSTVEFGECVPSLNNWQYFTYGSFYASLLCVYTNAQCSDKIICANVLNDACVDNSDGTSTRYYWTYPAAPTPSPSPAPPGEVVNWVSFNTTENCSGDVSDYLQIPFDECTSVGDGFTVMFSYFTYWEARSCVYSGFECEGRPQTCTWLYNQVCSQIGYERNQSESYSWGSPLPTPTPTPPPNTAVLCQIYNGSAMCSGDVSQTVNYQWGQCNDQDKIGEIFTYIGNNSAQLCAYSYSTCTGQPITCVTLTNGICYGQPYNNYVCSWGDALSERSLLASK